MVRKYQTDFEASNVACPNCGEQLQNAVHYELVHDTSIGGSVGRVRGDVIDRWSECIQCGHLDRELSELPDDAQKAWLEAWG